MEQYKEWFKEAKEALDELISEEGKVDGASFIRDYIQENWPDDLDESIDVENEMFDSYVNENIDFFEKWLKENFQNIHIGDEYDWGEHKGATLESSGNVDLELTEQQISLISLSLDKYDDSNILEISKVCEFLKKKKNFSTALDVALNIAEWRSNNYPVDSSAAARSWENVAEISLKLENTNSIYKYYERAGDIALSGSDYLFSAECYEKAFESYDGGKWKEELHLVRKSRVLYADSGVNEKASSLYVKECDVSFGKSDNMIRRFAGKSYKILSKYGESPWQVLIWIFLLIVTCAILYAVLEINTPGSGTLECNYDKTTVGMKCIEKSSEVDSPFTYLYFSVVTFTTLGYGDYSPANGGARIVSSFQAFFGLLFSSLFIATFLRKFSR